MGHTQNQSYEKRASILTPIKVVLANHNTGAWLQYHYTTVVKTIAHVKERGDYTDELRSEAPRVTTACADRFIAQAIGTQQFCRALSLPDH